MMTAAHPPAPIAATTSGTACLLLDAVDRGFVSRLAGRAHRVPSADSLGRDALSAVRDAHAAARDAQARVGEAEVDRAALAGSRPDPMPAPPRVAASWPVAAAVAVPPAPPWQPPDPGPGGPLVDRLLHAAAPAWEAIARRVEEAHAAGAFVVAVTGGRRREGRSTVVACLARTLVARGRRVEVCDRAPVDADLRADAPIVLVDAGIWFPGGPIRRGRVECESLGCHAAILVRQAGQPPCPARGEPADPSSAADG
jgi:hypothetical protein